MRTIIILLILSFTSINVQAGSALDKLHTLPLASILFVDKNEQALESKNPNLQFVPASTVKVLTSLLALEHWGEDYRFKTEFYLDEATNSLWIKGYGDPFLISEELNEIVHKIKLKGIEELDGIGTDSSHFSKTIAIDGQGQSLNPYDAAVGAVAANFNTINIRVYENSISSSEKQTPLTPLANQLANGLPIGTHRINLGNAEHTPRYFAELLKAKLNKASIPTDTIMLKGRIPSQAKLLFVHENSNTLSFVIKSMLEFSNNFIANQLFLALGADIYGAPANLEKSQKVMNEFIRNKYDWANYSIVEGAGLSRNNHLSAHQLIEILESFRPYIYLMPSQTNSIYAKSGTLKNVSTYAGYVLKNEHWSPFAIMINQAVQFRFREEVAKELLQ